MDSYCLQNKEKYLIYRAETADCPKRPFFPSSTTEEPPDFKQGT